MESKQKETVAIRDLEDLPRVRIIVRDWTKRLLFNLVDQTRLITSASELARNTVLYGMGGFMSIEVVYNHNTQGLQLTFEDKGPGIPDIEQALQDGFTTGGGLGLGLSGAKRLSHEFNIWSEVGKGTKVSIIRWKF